MAATPPCDVVTVTLNPCVDETRFLSTGSGSVARITRQSGGKGVNVARVLSALSVPCLAIAPAGGQTGARFADLARQEGVTLLTTPIRGETRTVVTHADTSGRTLKVEFGPPPGMDLAEVEALFAAVKGALEGAMCLMVLGSACDERSAELAHELIACAKARGVRTFLDAHGPALTHGVRALPDVLKLNRDELTELTGPVSDQDLEQKAKALIDSGIAIVIITLGARGALMVTGDQANYCPAPNVTAVNPVGSGDCFTAGWLYAQWMGYTDNMALAVGNCAGAANAARFEAARIGKQDIEALLGYRI